MPSLIDLTNKKFGKWLVLEKDKNNIHHNTYWICKCECGTIRSVAGNSLKNGSSTNCGCTRKEKLSEKRINLLGKKFNSLTVIEKADKGLWKCQCDCGNISYVSSYSLTSNQIKHCKQCGYQSTGIKNTKDLVGQRFGKLLVLKQEESKNGRTNWLCQCDCGNKKIIAGNSLRKGLTKSCGCLKSIGEEKIIKLLLDNNISYEYQKTFETCRFSDTNSLAKFDFYINNSYIIEYDGQQHFEYTNNGWNTKENYEKLQQKDIEKTNWCKFNNIPLIRIPYTHLKEITLKDLMLETSKFIV